MEKFKEKRNFRDQYQLFGIISQLFEVVHVNSNNHYYIE